MVNDDQIFNESSNKYKFGFGFLWAGDLLFASETYSLPTSHSQIMQTRLALQKAPIIESEEEKKS